MDLIAKGNTLVCEIADFDACDQYLFHIDNDEGVLVTHWKLRGCGDNGDVTIGEPPLAAANKLLTFSQGGVYRWKSGGFSESCDEGCTCHTVPFLLGRATLAALRVGEPVDVNIFGEVQTFTKQGTEKRDVNVRGETKSIDAIHATSHDGDLWIVDDAKWPVVLRVETAGGDNYCELQSISAESIEAAESALD